MVWRKVLDRLIFLERKPTEFEGHSHARNDLLQICCMLPDGILILGGRISSSVLPTNPNVVVWFHGQNGYTLYCYYMKASKTSPWFSDCWLHCLPMALLIPKWQFFLRLATPMEYSLYTNEIPVYMVYYPPASTTSIYINDVPFR